MARGPVARPFLVLNGRVTPVTPRRYPPALPGWPVRVFISGAGSAYHATPYCSLLKAGQAKAEERGHVVTRAVCVSMREATERRRKACRGCVPVRRD